MSVLDESAAKMRARLERELHGKSRTTLKNVAAACDEIETAHGVMNYARVGAVATARFGGPLVQSILNNKSVKAYIAKRIEEYEGRSRAGGRKRRALDHAVAEEDKYPAEGLDAKTRLCIDILRERLKRLEAENSHISRLLETTTESTPIGISDAISRGPTDTGALVAKLGPTPIPNALRLALRRMLGRDVTEPTPVNFAVRQRDEWHMLVCTDGGVERTLLTPAEWADAVQWLEEMADGG